jgi:A/G-specific adenine glycosylase
VSRRTRADVADELRRALLRWYEPRRSAYPWRASRDPYAVLVSEVMLQQTQAPRVVAPYRAFMKRFPSVRALAAASPSEVIREWSGLGYNRRAVALSRAARAIVGEHGGRIPSDPAALQRLPGIGPYTAAAVASLGHGRAVPMVETNVRRVLGRMERLTDGDIDAVAERWLDRDRPADWNQALMDLGREVCRPGRPRCDACPLHTWCRSAGRAERRPARSRQSTFEGSFRQVRGRIVAELSDGGSRSISSLLRAIDVPPDSVIRAVRALARDRLVSAGEAAMAGAPTGRVSLVR